MDLDITQPFNEKGIPNHLVGQYPTSAIFFAGNPIKNNELTSYGIADALKNFLPLLDELTGKIKKDILNKALLYAVFYHKKQGYNNEEYIEILIKHGANPEQCYDPTNTGNLIIDLAKEKGLLYLFPTTYLEKRILSQRSILMVGNTRESELSQFSQGELHVNEDYYSIVSLIRNKKCSNTEHVFIVIEKIIHGRSVMHFIDFVKDMATNDSKGKIRHQHFEGKITDSLLFNCKLLMMEVKDINDLVCQSWQITNEACDKLLINIELDKTKEIDYLIVGNRSLFGRSSNKKGHNCYTWAREKLRSTGSPKIEQALKLSIEEWIGTLPSLKDRPWYKNRLLLYSASAFTFTGFAITTGMSLYNNYNNGSIFKPNF